MATAVANESLFLQAMGCYRDAFTAHAKDVGYQLLGHDQFIGLDPIVTEKETATQLLFNRVQPVADRGLRHLSE